MQDLLELAIDAHGGIQKWEQFKEVSAHMKLSGILWKLLGHENNELADCDYTTLLREQKGWFDNFELPGQQAIWTRQEITISQNGKVIDKLCKPRRSFDNLTFGEPYSKAQLVYFFAYACNTYYTIPFVFTLPGFETREIDPWHEGGEVWRRLEVIFPEDFDYHTRTQIFYFDKHGFLKRNDYQVEIGKGSGAVHYVFDYKEFQGIMLPTRRQVYLRDENRHYIKEPLLVLIEADKVIFR